MPVRVQCSNPDCRKSYSVADEQLGRTAVCKHCGCKFTLEASGKETAEPSAQTAAEQVSPAGSADTAPSKLGRFEIRSQLGSGAFGSVYRAYDPVLHREVALKVPRAAVLERPRAKARFLREPKAAAQLRHPNIVPVYEAGNDGPHYYIASAYIEGRTLQALIDEDRPDFRRAAEIVRDLAHALDYAHGVGVVHRDVKPANVMIDEQGQAMLTDFGLARLETSEEKLTQDGALMGTPAYMAPEQAGGSFGEVGPASDQYSLGVVLYELLCGQTPFSGPPAILVYNVVNREPPSPRSIDPQIPEDLEAICLKAMAKSPDARYRTSGRFADELDRWLRGKPIEARAPGRLQRAWWWCRRNPVVAVLASAVALLLLVLVITWSRADRAPSGLVPDSREGAGLAAGESARETSSDGRTATPQPVQEETLRASAHRGQSMTNLKRIGLAMHMHHDVFRTFPTAASCDNDGKPLLSWRVTLLPFVGQEILYEDFHLDEPWDSPHNKGLIEYMPEVYRHPARQNDGKTCLMVFAGEGTPFGERSNRGPQLRGIVDGAESTIMVVEAGPDKAVPWTKPEDLPFNPDNPGAALGSVPLASFPALLFDGSVHTIPKDVEAETLRALITHRGREKIRWSDVTDP